LIEACPALGLRVPEDLAVVGFNGSVTEASYFCDLTTVRAPWARVGQTAVNLLLDLIDGGKAAPHTVLPVELVQGSTT
jgi:DNA-binding LacI/PurR family transcriptional regulator